MKDIKQDLTDRLLLLRSRYEVAFYTRADATARDAPTFAAVVEAGLHDGLDSALTVVRAVVDPAEMRAPAFWQTPLGALFFAAGGFPGQEMPQTLAASVLGCSRQYVSSLVKDGKLATPSAAASRRKVVSAEAVRDLLRAKLDKFVN